MPNLAIIPARGGSKRIPRKNIKNFKGKPIIAYSIELALQSGLFEEVMVSTDDQEIAEVAIKYGAKVPFMRSEKNADDFATSLDVLQEVITEYENRNRSFDSVCSIYPTAPLILIEDLELGYKKMLDLNCDVVYPLIPFGYPILRGLVIDADGSPRMKWPENYRVRSQDLEPVYHDAGQWYWYNWQSLKNNKFDTTRAIILSELQVQDIDTNDDWLLAELKYEILKKRK